MRLKLGLIVITSILIFGTAFAVLAWTNPAASPPGGNPPPPIQLQTVTPGTAQTGNLHISGAGIFGGNVGIGTTAPGARLQVTADGTFQTWLTGSTNPNNRLYLGYDTTGDFGSIQAITEGVAFRPLVLQRLGGNVGIGTTAPATRLAVGTLATAGNVGSAAFFGLPADTDVGVVIARTGVANPAELWIGANQAGLFTSLQSAQGGIGMRNLILNPISGNVGIGTTAPGARLDVVGEIRIAQTGLACISTTAGMMRFIAGGFEACDGTRWRVFVTNPTFTLTINSSGATGINITSTTGHDGVTNYSRSVPGAKTVNLTAPATHGELRFAGWSGCVTSNSMTINFTMPSGSMTCTARYSQRRAFIASATVTGGFGGLSGGDSICQTRANEAGWGGSTWRALLSTDTVHARDRIPDAVYVRMDGLLIANNRTDLWDGTIANAISLNEHGAARPTVWVWTGTNSDGTRHTQTCANWTGFGGNWGRVGEMTTSSAWVNRIDPVDCGFGNALYCFEQ